MSVSGLVLCAALAGSGHFFAPSIYYLRGGPQKIVRLVGMLRSRSREQLNVSLGNCYIYAAEEAPVLLKAVCQQGVRILPLSHLGKKILTKTVAFATKDRYKFFAYLK